MKKFILYSIAIFVASMSSFLVANADIVANPEDEACNCDHCDIVIASESENNGKKNNDTAVQRLRSKEDLDGDGNLEICARDRDLRDKSFPSLCHMFCYNRCTRFDSRVILDQGKENRKIATAYRTSYYKLKDGACENV